MNIYVGNLNYSASGDDLTDLFGQYGAVESAKIIIDRVSQRSKGFGFVEMADSEAAESAIQALNNSEFMGRKIVVNQARERERR